MEWKFARLASGIEYAADHPHALRPHPHRHHPHSAARLAARYVERVHSVPPPFSLPIMLHNFYRWVRGHRWETRWPQQWCEAAYMAPETRRWRQTM